MLLEGLETPPSSVPDFMPMTNSVNFQFVANKLECLSIAYIRISLGTFMTK